MKWILLACTAALAFAQGTEPKPKAAEYDVSGRSDEIEIGAEFMVHSFSGEGQMFIAEDFLIVEVALYPPKDGVITVNPGAFSLRVNGKKPALLPLAPQAFAATLQRGQWSGGFGGPDMSGGGRGGGIGGVGGPIPSQTGGPFPRRTPTPPRAPAPGSPGGIDRADPVKADEVAVHSALPQGETNHPVSGFLYFPYRGKISGIKSLEFVYERAVLKLR